MSPKMFLSPVTGGTLVGSPWTLGWGAVVFVSVGAVGTVGAVGAVATGDRVAGGADVAGAGVWGAGMRCC